MPLQSLEKDEIRQHMSNEIKFTKFTIEPDDVDSRFLAVHVERYSEHRQYYMVGRYFYVLVTWR